jgi:hypothetical protein
MIAGLLPVILAVLHFYTNVNAVNALSNELEVLQLAALTREKKQSQNMSIRENYKNADHFYIDKHLETLTFLEPEAEELQKLVVNRNYAGDEAVKKRLEFLTGPGNSLLFSESNIETFPFFKETVSTLVHPVEINNADLMEILSLVEGQPIGPYKPGPNRPQLIILDFKIDRKEATDKNDVYVLNMKLLMREYQ